DDRVAAEIHRVLPDGGTVHIAGGGNAIRTDVENELRNAGYNVVRHAGRNRFETATLVAEQIPAPGTAFLATGLKFADALPAGAAAAAVRGVVVLTANSDMPVETAAYLQARPNIQRIAVGGPASRADPSATSIVGADRFETAAILAERFFTGAANVGVASGANFPDALGGGAHVGFRGGPLLLTRPETLSEPARRYLSANRSSLRNVFIYGGPNAVSSSTETEIRAATT
ncbi:MAG: cell wall-binding repeat-containing protein, partial [Actinobacteria bacterium]|nr:cell wall-binding repeat-containing protein [Actinomycetota bacterium]